MKQQNWTPFAKRLWQRNYYERIIRTPIALHNIQQYILNNPQDWTTDRLK